MRLGTLLSGSCLLSHLACAEAPPLAQVQTPGAQSGQPGQLGARPEGQGGAPALAGQGQVQGQAPGTPAGAPLTAEPDEPPAPPPGEPEAQLFAPGDQSVEIQVQLQGFDTQNEHPFELHFVQIMQDDFGRSVPRVVHIELFEGENPVKVSAPSHMDVPLYLMAIEGDEKDRSFSGLGEPISLQDQDLQVTLSQGESPEWMAQLPLGKIPENTQKDEPADPPEQPEGAGAQGAAPAAQAP